MCIFCGNQSKKKIGKKSRKFVKKIRKTQQKKTKEVVYKCSQNLEGTHPSFNSIGLIKQKLFPCKQTLKIDKSQTFFFPSSLSLSLSLSVDCFIIRPDAIFSDRPKNFYKAIFEGPVVSHVYFCLLFLYCAQGTSSSYYSCIATVC